LLKLELLTLMSVSIKSKAILESPSVAQFIKLIVLLTAVARFEVLNEVWVMFKLPLITLIFSD